MGEGENEVCSKISAKGIGVGDQEEGGEAPESRGFHIIYVTVPLQDGLMGVFWTGHY